ncbi:MAG TPA: hypothetical protein VK917_06495, partial [Ilumatobacter sp.]|nr:hypothetical protein [Ilumatobacter sp.]
VDQCSAEAAAVTASYTDCIRSASGTPDALERWVHTCIHPAGVAMSAHDSLQQRDHTSGSA